MTPGEKTAIGQALQIAVLSEDDLSFARQSRAYPVSPPIVGTCLSRPVAAIETLLGLHEKSDPSLKLFLKQAFTAVYGDPASTLVATEQVLIPPTVELPEKLRGPVADLLSSIASANAKIRQALSKLTPEEKRGLIESLPTWAAQGTDIKFEFISKSRMTSTALESALAKIELGTIREAAQELSAATEAAVPNLRQAAKDGWKGSVSFAVSGIPVEICGSGDDEHKALASGLCIDLGGRNRYKGRYGAGIGYASVLIDLGNDTKADFVDAAGGAGVLGIGIAHFLGVRPDLYGKALSYGAGVGGVGIAVVEQQCRIESRSLGQGFGIAGVGALVLGKGSDTLKIGYLGQGAGMLGGMGWLVNHGGNDRYRAGGLIPDSTNPGGFICRAQGYAGLMPGGLGLITDLGGDDLYEAGTDSQGSARAFGIGSIYDAGGNDTYLALTQSQASATAEGVAAQFDLDGDDTYVVRKGSCHSHATDRSVAILVDREGDDLYAARDSRPALAQEGSVSIFLDEAGSDRYAGPVGIGVLVNGRPGIALFVNLGGDDAFADGPLPGTAGSSGSQGISFAADDGVVKDPAPIKPGSVSAKSEEIDSLWEQVRSGGARSAPSARKLAEIGEPALERFCTQFAGTAPTSMIKVAAALVLNEPAAKATLIEQFSKVNPFARASLYQIATLAKVIELKGTVSEGLKNDVTRRAAVRYAAVAGAKDAVDQISGIVLSGDAITAEDAMIALAALADDSMAPTMEALLTNQNLVIRRAALGFLAKSSRRMALGQSLLSRSDERSLLLGVELMGLVGTPEALQMAGSGLNSNLTAVRIKALHTLNGRVPNGYRQRVLELINDQNALVSMVAKGVDLGRQ